MYVFLSHSSNDNEITDKIAKVLDKHHVIYWVDGKEIRPGSSVDRKIEDGIENSTHFFLIWSKNAKESEGVMNEVDLANDSPNKKRLTKISLRLDNTGLPSGFAGKKYYRIASDNVDKTVYDIIQEIQPQFKEYVKKFKKQICYDYENFSKNSIIPNFRKFNGYKFFVQQKYDDHVKKIQGEKIADYVLNMIKDFQQQITHENILKKEINAIKEKCDLKNNKIKSLVRELKRTTTSSKSNNTDKINQEIKIKKKKIEDEKIELKNIEKELSKKENEFKKIKKEKIIPIIGEYGSGKSALCHYILYMLCKEEEGKFTLFIPLGDLKKHKQKGNYLKQDIYDYVKENYDIPLTYEDFLLHVEEGNFIFILDALDEMSSNLNRDTAQNNLKSALDLSLNSIVILTSRHTYLSDKMEKILLFDYKKLIEILDFEPEEIKQFIGQKLGEDNSRIQEINQTIKDDKIKDLARKPLFLSVICTHFDKLKEYFVINESVILKILTEEWIKHDVLTKNHLQEEKDAKIEERERISEILAVTEYRNGVPIAIKDLETQVFNELRYDNSTIHAKLKKYYKEAATCTFLSKEEGDRYRFILRPVMEYFVARHIVNLINRNKMSEAWELSNKIHTLETFDFIKGITEIDWAIKSYILRQMERDLGDNEIKFLKLKEDRSRNILDFLDTVKNKKDKKIIKGFFKILLVTKNLPLSFEFDEFDINFIDAKKSNLDNINLKNSSLKEADFSGTSLTKANLEGANLSKANLANANISEGNLKHADLTGADLRNSNLTEADLSYANLQGAKLNGANLNKTTIDGANLSRIIAPECNIKNSNLNRVNLKNADLSKCNLRDTVIEDSNLENINLKEADLRDGKITNSNLRNALMDKSDLYYTSLNNSILANVTLHEAKLRRADLSNTDLTEAKLTDTELSNLDMVSVDLQGANLSKVDLTGANLTGADLKNCKLSGSILHNVSLRNTDLRDADLKNASFDEADLSGADLSGADLKNCELMNLNLSDTNMSRVNLANANLQGANLNRADFGIAKQIKENPKSKKTPGYVFGNVKLNEKLQGANLTGANLKNADLREVNLRKTNLTGADLSGANLTGADLSGAIIDEANFEGSILVDTNLQVSSKKNTNLEKSFR